MSNGYLIPDNATPETLRCIRVYVPDDPLYVAALIGSITYLSTWTAWERDSAKRGKLAASAWKDANEVTLSNMENQCDNCDLCKMTKEELREIISQELENMSIIINNCCGCGGGAVGSNCGSGIDEMPPADAPTNPPREFPPVNQPPITSNWIKFKCNMSHYYYAQLRNSVLGISDLVDAGTATYQNILQKLNETIGSLIPGADDFLDLTWEASYMIVTWFVSRVIGLSASDMVQEMDRKHSEFVCAVYSNDDPGQQSQAVRSVIDSLALSWAAKYWIKLVEERIPYDQIFYADGWETYEFPPSFQNRDCSTCSPPSQDDLTPAPQGYFYVKALPSEVTLTPNNNTAELNYDGDVWTHTPIGNDTYHEVWVDIDEVALKTRVNATSIHGAVVRFLSGSGDLTNARLRNFPTTNGGDVAHTLDNDVLKYDNAEYNNVPEFADFCDQYQSKGAYGNGEPDATWRSDTYGSSNPGAMSYKVWLICKE